MNRLLARIRTALNARKAEATTDIDAYNRWLKRLHPDAHPANHPANTEA